MSTTATAPRRYGGERVVLFIVTSFWAHGELAIATEFAARLAGTGLRPLFLIPPSHRQLIAASGLDHQVLIPGAGKINRILLHDIALTRRPALVVLADFLNYDFCDRHYGLTRADLTVFECPVGTFDNFTWGRPGTVMDTYGFRAKHQDQMSIDALAFRLRPCPLNNPLTVDDSVFTYPLLDPAVPALGEIVPETVRQVRAELDLPPGRPLVLLTGATWQRMHVQYPAVKTFVEACTVVLERMLRRVMESATVVTVGASTVFTQDPPPGFRALPALDPAAFLRLASAADLHVSNNLVSVSLHRLALAGIPSVALFSSLVREDGRIRSLLAGSVPQGAADVLAEVAHLYPFRMFPVGWYRFLRTLVEGNPFQDVVRHVEIFDLDAGLAAIRALLEPGPDRDRLADARESYVDALASLPDVPTVMARLTSEVSA